MGGCGGRMGGGWCLLFIIGCWGLRVESWLLFVEYCLLFIVCCLLKDRLVQGIVCWLLIIVYCLLSIERSLGAGDCLLIVDYWFNHKGHEGFTKGTREGLFSPHPRSVLSLENCLLFIVLPAGCLFNDEKLVLPKAPVRASRNGMRKMEASRFRVAHWIFFFKSPHLLFLL